MCSFCSCRGCDVCASYTEDPGKRVQIHSTDCPIGVELMVVSERNFRKGWHYDAKLHVGDWQPNALITVDFAQHHESVEIDPAQIKAAALKWDKKASFQIELGSYPDEIGGASFGFTILKGRFDNNEGPTVVCTNVHPVPPARPRPPPPPHRPYRGWAPPRPVGFFRTALQQCALGGVYNSISIWNEGSSYRGGVVMAVWRAGAEITLDFRQHAPEENAVTGLEATHASYATILPSIFPGSLVFRLNDAPDDKNGFSFVGHGGKIHMQPVVTCSLTPHTGSAALPPPSSSLVISPTCLTLGLSYTLVQKWHNGFKALVAVRNWIPNARVELRYPGSVVSLNDRWSATDAGSPAGFEGIALLLGEKPDEEHHGFGFSARGSIVREPHISCEIDQAFVGLTMVPAQLCGMGASYRFEEKHGSPGVVTVHVRIDHWQAGAIVNVAFPADVETVMWPTSATETSSAVASTHTFRLSSHPDSDHGLSFDVSSSVQAQPISVTCRPKQSEADALADRQVKAGTPEGPMTLRTRVAGCDSIEVSWHAAVDNGFSVKGYKVYYRRSEASDASGFETVETNGGGTSTTLTGLSGGTTYLIKVHARNSQGEGKFSERTSATTNSAGAPQTPPTGLEPLESPDCHSVTLSMPKLRAGCHGDSFLSLQMRAWSDGATTPWSDVVSMAAEATATVRELSPFQLYEFRAVPHNSVGTGPPSGSTGAVMVQAFKPVLAPPLVASVSSASFSIRWTSASSTCRPNLRWRISYTKDVGGSLADAAWHELTNNATGSSFVSYPLRCHPPGCSFRVQFGTPSIGWLQPSAPSASVSSVQLPALAADGMRIELRLRAEQPDRDLLQMRLDAANDVANVLHIPIDKLVVEDIYGSGRYIVIQLKDAVQGSNRARTRAQVLAQQLGILAQELENGEGGGLESCLVADKLDGATGVRLLTSDGRLTPLLISTESRAILERLPRYYGDTKRGVPVLALAQNLTIAATILGLMAYCCQGFYRHSHLIHSSRVAAYGYGHVAPDDEAALGERPPTRSARSSKSRRGDRSTRAGRGYGLDHAREVGLD